MSDRRDLRQKLEAMAGQVEQSPHEAAIARAKLAEMGAPPTPPRPPAPAGAPSPGFDPRFYSTTVTTFSATSNQVGWTVWIRVDQR